MPAVILHYGPYEAYGVIKHRTQRLHGLLTVLTTKDYEVEIIPCQHLNRLTVEMEGSIIFQCDIRHLLFNMECEDDAVCQRVIAAIDEAANRIYCDKNVPTFVSIKEGKRYLEKCKNLTTKDYFSSSICLLYEHQVHFREDKVKAAEPSFKEEQQVWSPHDEYSDYGEQDDFIMYDEYADWDFASSIIKAILESLPQAADVVDVDETFARIGKGSGFFIK